MLSSGTAISKIKLIYRHKNESQQAKRTKKKPNCSPTSFFDVGLLPSDYSYPDSQRAAALSCG